PNSLGCFVTSCHTPIPPVSLITLAPFVEFMTKGSGGPSSRLLLRSATNFQIWLSEQAQCQAVKFNILTRPGYSIESAQEIQPSDSREPMTRQSKRMGHMACS